MSGFTRTPNLALYKPTPNADNDAWGGHLNTNADVLDALLGSGGAASGPWLPLSGGTVTGHVYMSNHSLLDVAGINSYGAAPLPFANAIQTAGYRFWPPGGTITFSGAGQPYIDINANYAGAISSSQIIAANRILASSDILAAPLTNSFAWFDVNGNIGWTPWTPTTTYAVNSRVASHGRIYNATTGGTSAGSGGPTGTSGAITDGSVTWAYQSPNNTGDRVGIYTQLHVVSEAGDVTAGRTQGMTAVGVGGAVQIDASQGGTNLTTGAAGGAFGGNFLAGLSPGCTNYGYITGCEVSVDVQAGASVKNKVGLQVVQTSLDAVNATNGVDVGIGLFNQSPQGTAPGWAVGLGFGASASGYFPVRSNGTIIQAGSQGGTQLAAHGIDFSSVTFSGDAFKSAGFVVDGTGAVALSASLQFVNSPTYPSGAQPTSLIRLFSNNSLGGSGVVGTAYGHRFLSNGDQVQFVTTGGINELVFHDVTHNFGGGTTRGGRVTAAINQTLTGATTNRAAGIDPFNVGLVINHQVQVNDGGTGLQNPQHANATATPQGSFTSFAIQSSLNAAASNISGQSGIEVDIGGHAGSSALNKQALLISKWSFDSYQAKIDDAAIAVRDQLGAVGWLSGIRFGSSMAQWPIDPNYGAIISGTYSQAGGAFQAAARYGIDFSDVAFPAFGTTRMGGFLSSNNFGVDGLGAVMLGSAYLTPSANGLTIDCKGLISTGATVAAGGSGYSVNDMLYDPYGGMYRVATLSGTAVATVTPYTDSGGTLHVGNYPSATPPTNPIATTVWDWATGIASGCTLNLTWNTGATNLYLQPSGGHTQIGGPAQVVSFFPAAGYTFMQATGGSLVLDAVSADITLGWSGTNRIVANAQLQIAANVGFNNTSPIAKPTGWGAPTGTATRTTFVTSSVTLPVLAEHVKALIDDLTAYGLIGA